MSISWGIFVWLESSLPVKYLSNTSKNTKDNIFTQQAIRGIIAPLVGKTAPALCLYLVRKTCFYLARIAYVFTKSPDVNT